MTPDGPPSIDPSARIIDELAAGGDYVDDGRFSVDLARAGAKLGSFALAEPAAWVVLMVEAGWLLEAEAVDFECDAMQAVVAIRGRGLERQDLDGLSAWALADVPSGAQQAHARARRQLALAYLALLAQSPRSVEILSLGSEPDALPCRARFDPDAEPRERCELIELDEARDEGLDEGPGLRLVARFDFDDARPERERAVLERRCSCSSIAVRIEAFNIAKGSKRIFGNPTLADPEVLADHHEVPIVLDGETIGRAGLHYSERDAAFLRILVNGAQVEDIALLAPPGFRAIVEADLRRDLSLRKVLRDARFEQVLAAVAAATEAEIALLDEPSEAERPNEAEQPSQPVEPDTPSPQSAALAVVGERTLAKKPSVGPIEVSMVSLFGIGVILLTGSTMVPVLLGGVSLATAVGLMLVIIRRKTSWMS